MSSPGTSSAQAILPTGALIDEISRHETRFLIDEIFERGVYPIPAVGGASRPVIVDIGSNIGVFVHYAKHVCPNALVYAVEPVPPVAAVLRKNVSGFEGVHVIECGIGAIPATMEVTYYPGYSIMSRLNANLEADKGLLANCIRQDLRGKVANEKALSERHVEAALGRKLEAGQKYDCVVKTLPGLFADEGIGDVFFLKMDVEGSETEILRSLPPPTWAMIQNIAIEVHEYQESSDTLGELRGILDQRGYATSVAHPTADRCPRTIMLYGDGSARRLT